MLTTWLTTEYCRLHLANGKLGCWSMKECSGVWKKIRSSITLTVKQKMCRTHTCFNQGMKLPPMQVKFGPNFTSHCARRPVRHLRLTSDKKQCCWNTCTWRNALYLILLMNKRSKSSKINSNESGWFCILFVFCFLTLNHQQNSRISKTIMVTQSGVSTILD